MTLLELLIVIGIMLLLAATTVPKLIPAMKDHKLREASRLVNAFFAGAKARAAERDRPVGVFFERDLSRPNAVRQLFLAEIPPKYSGDVTNAGVNLRFVKSGSTTYWQLRFTGSSTLSATRTLVEQNEYFQLQFNHVGPQYIVRRIADPGSLVSPPDLDFFLMALPGDSASNPIIDPPSGTPESQIAYPLGFWSPGADGLWGSPNYDDDGDGANDNDKEAGMSGNSMSPCDDIPTYQNFEITRLPKKVSGSSLQLPEGIAIDLGFSGEGSEGMDYGAYNPLTAFTATPTPGVASNLNPLIVTFLPNGEPHGIYGLSPSVASLAWTPTRNLYFLIGKYENVSTNAWESPTLTLSSPQLNQAGNPLLTNGNVWSRLTSQNTNLAETTCLWIVVGARTGAITTAENALFNTSPISGPPSRLGTFLLNARQIARSGQTKGGT